MKYPQGKKAQERYLVSQQMFRATGPNDVTKLFWVIHNPGAETFLNSDEPNATKHYVQSGLFESSDGMMWRLRFEPGEWPNGKK